MPLPFQGQDIAHLVIGYPPHIIVATVGSGICDPIECIIAVTVPAQYIVIGRLPFRFRNIAVVERRAAMIGRIVIDVKGKEVRAQSWPGR